MFISQYGCKLQLPMMVCQKVLLMVKNEGGRYVLSKVTRWGKIVNYKRKKKVQSIKPPIYHYKVYQNLT